MSRYYNAINVSGSAEAYKPYIETYMTGEGFSLVDYNGQKVWKKGIGLVAAPQYLAIRYEGNSVHLEAFIRFALLPGVYIGEMGVDGFFGAVPKKLLKDRVKTIENYILSVKID